MGLWRPRRTGKVGPVSPDCSGTCLVRLWVSPCKEVRCLSWQRLMIFDHLHDRKKVRKRQKERWAKREKESKKEK